MADAISYDKFFPAVPLVGATIAVCFDVGYFYGVGIDYFTFFSLTEHIGFALEALPVALVIAISVMFTTVTTEAPVTWYGDRAISEANDLSRPVQERLSRLKRKKAQLQIVAALLFLLLACGSAYLWHAEYFRSFLYIIVVIAMLLVRVTTKKEWHVPILLLIMGCTGALLFGEFAGSSYISQTTAIDTIVPKSGEAIPANVIRSGERGVLYAKPVQGGIVEFTKWDEIKSISRNRKISMFDWQRK
jgi:hypothetical protein